MENQTIQPSFSVSEAIAVINQTLDYAYPSITVEGEVSGYKVSQNKWVFFDIKDPGGTLNCFATVYGLRTQIEDGMRVRVVAQPRISPKWGKFSLTVRSVQPVGEGSLKRAFELLKAKLEKEGLFAPERKRLLPQLPDRIGVISSTQAAGYEDFKKIISDRWGGVELVVAHTQVQGDSAPGQIVRALEHFNQMSEPVDVVAIIRGGGSSDDLAAFNDEPLVRAIASSRIPTIVGVGHEVDVSLADLAADVRAATPSNAAQILVPDKREIIAAVRAETKSMLKSVRMLHSRYVDTLEDSRARLLSGVTDVYERTKDRYAMLTAVLSQLNPRTALARGYALVFDESRAILRQPPPIGAKLTVETENAIIKVGVEDVEQKHS